MEIYLKRWFWTLPLFMIAVCAILAALGVNHVVEAKYLLAADGTARPAHHTARPVKREVKPVASKDAQDVTGRNIFCSTCDPPKPADTPAAAPVDENHPPLTSLPLALLATIVASNSSASAATIYNTQSFKSGSYRVGDGIQDAGQLRKIHPKTVDFWNKNSNRLERIELLPSGSAPIASAPPPPIAPPVSVPVEGQSPDADLLTAVDKGVKKIDDTHYDIERGLIDKILTDPTAAARAARIVPSIKDGKPNGFKLYAIRPNSLFAKIGMQNGDTISSINGFDMSSPDKALEVYTKVRSATNLSVSVVRRGQPVNMDYSIK
jgi:general secretion pathway protein C